MNIIDIAGRVCGILMTLGAGGILLLLSDLLYRLLVVAADAADAAVHGRRRKNPDLLLNSGVSAGFSGIHGSVPVTAALIVSGILIWLDPDIRTAPPVSLILMWGVMMSCYADIRHRVFFCMHASLFAGRFCSAYHSFPDCRKALESASLAVPDGQIRRLGFEAAGKLDRGKEWKSAVRVFDNGSFSGKSLSVILSLFGDERNIPDEDSVLCFASSLSDLAETFRRRMSALDNSRRMLLTSAAVFSAVCIFRMMTGLSPAESALLSAAGIILAAGAVMYRNVIVNGEIL